MVKTKPILIIIAILLLGGGIYWYTVSSNKMENVTEENLSTQVTTEEKAGETEKAYLDISPEKAKELIDNNGEIIVIDVSPKYDGGHIPGAVNYYVGDGSLDEAIPNLDSGKEYLVYCHTDEASMLGAQKLIDAGFLNVYRLEGNYSTWVDASYEIETTNTLQ